MIIKRCIFCGFVFGFIVFSGCRIQEDYQTTASNTEQNIEETSWSEEVSDSVAIGDTESFKKISVPEHYNKEFNNVVFDCDVELSKDADVNNIRAVEYKSTYYSDLGKAKELFGKGKTEEYVEHYPDQDSDVEPESVNYSDNSGITAGGTELYMFGKNSDYYREPFLKISTEADDKGVDAFDFLSPGESKEKLKDLLSYFGYDIDTDINCYGLSYDVAKKWESHFTDEGEVDDSKYKPEWTPDDNAYLLYSYQMIQGLPVFNATTSIGSYYAVYSPYNAPIQAIYTKSGFEQVYVSLIYEVNVTDEKVQLLDFESIASTVNDKFANLISSERYFCNRAVLAEKVKKVGSSGYSFTPVWYFEVATKDDSMVVLVDAVTGKEVTI